MVYSMFSVVLVVLLPSLLMVARTRPAAYASDLQDALNAVLAEEDDTTVHFQGIFDLKVIMKLIVKFSF